MSFWDEETPTALTPTAPVVSTPILPATHRTPPPPPRRMPPPPKHLPPRPVAPHPTNATEVAETEPKAKQKPEYRGAFTVEQLNHAKWEAQTKRHRALLTVYAGKRDLKYLLNRAADPEHKYLTKLRLVQVLESQPEWSRNKALKCVNHVITVSGTKCDKTATELNVGWLLNPQGAGNRMDALIDFLVDRRETPWPGFPYAPNPNGGW